MADESTELLEMRCRACGQFMGYRRRIGRFVFWCSEACAESHMAKYDESQIRDEEIVTMYLEGNGVLEISRRLDNWPYQYVQQTLARRGLTEANREQRTFVVDEHTRIDSEGKEHQVPRRVLVRSA